MNFKSIVLVISCIVFFNHVNAQTTSEKPEGEGTAISPYEIKTLSHLRWMSEDFYFFQPYEGHFVLKADIDASETKTWNDGKGFKPVEKVSSFDGLNYSISNLFINRPDENDVGFIGRYIVEHVRNLQLINVDITGNVYVGGAAGSNNLTQMSNIFVSGKVTGTNHVGGIIGDVSEFQSSALINAAQVNGDEYVGGIVGRIAYLHNVGSKKLQVFHINDKNYGDVSGNDFVGPFVGHIDQVRNKDFKILYFFNSGKITNNGSENDFLQQELDQVFDESYNDSQSSGFTSTVKGVTNLTTEQLGNSSNYSSNFLENNQLTTVSEISTTTQPYSNEYFKPFKFEFQNDFDKGVLLSVEGFKNYGLNEEMKAKLNFGSGIQFKRLIIDGETFETNEISITAKKGQNTMIIVDFEYNPVFSGGKGTSDDPYQITDINQLQQIAFNKNLQKDTYFIINNDIDADNLNNKDEGFIPIENLKFLDGQGHTIHNLILKKGGVVKFNYGLIRNLKLKNAEGNINTDGPYVGILTDFNSGVIDNVHIEGNLETTRTNAGLIAGYFQYGNVKNCSVEGMVTAHNYVGGLIGNAYRTIIENCVTNVKVKGENYVGGSIGYSYNSTLSNLISYGSIESTLTEGKINAAGITTTNQNNTAEESYFDNTKIGMELNQLNDQEKGKETSFFGDENNFLNFDLENIWHIKSGVYNETDELLSLQSATAEHYIAVNILQGDNLVTNLTKSKGYKIGDTVNLSVELIIGYKLDYWLVNGERFSSENPLSITIDETTANVFNAVLIEDYEVFDEGDGSTTNPYQISTFEQLVAFSNIEALTYSSFVLTNDIDASASKTIDDGKGFNPRAEFGGEFNGQGYTISDLQIHRDMLTAGLVQHLKNSGRMENIHLKNISFKGDIMNLGGIAGTTNINVHIYGCSVTGELTSISSNTSYIGGLVGSTGSSQLSYNRTNVSISGGSYCGGLAASIHNMQINNSYASGRINTEDDTNKKAFIGIEKGFNEFSNNYYDSDNAGVSSGGGNAVGLTRDQFADKTNFPNWDFDNLFIIEDDIDSQFEFRPVIREQYVTISTDEKELIIRPIVGRYYKNVPTGMKVKTVPYRIMNSLSINDNEIDFDGTIYTAWQKFDENYHISADISWVKYQVSTEVNGDGSIEPMNPEVDHGSSQLFTFTPVNGGEILDVLIDGESIGTVDEYLMEDIIDRSSIKVIFSTVTSLETNLNKIQVYPNPSNNTVYIKTKTLGASAQLINLQGQLLKEFEIENFKQSVDISSLQKGIYLLKIGSETYKIIKE
ncbi:T9SS type A sorting domain-containing protein [Flammeovirga sp. MY04]|uniref:T9SS type A sorting domain-containing protein n=1 Tax=Flammeovirga sp. MY04 TaxID=1191459 RepID=UPI0008060884|nr:T9SS type A sorting domain-containing protein [Flammeovirga sp. MY04]ANQ48035.1 T9SS type A sorting domain-containing protein [Flammeovirga sp. MY04]